MSKLLTEVDAESARVLLHQFSEWLDHTGPHPMSLTHDDLVDRFLVMRDPHAIPVIV